MTGRSRVPGLLWPALWRMAFAGAVFIIVYGGCNRLTAMRHDVGTWMWEWERHIPFIREMVVPYWSLDLFFCGAFLLCGSKVELNLLTKRLVVVTVLSGVCFLLFPLRLAIPRPEPHGWTAPLFHALYANDMPYNMAPSLHISLRSLVWVCYGAHLRGRIRSVTKAWFILIGASTLLVWQHHVIDVATGFVMGWLVAALVPDPRQTADRTGSSKLAWRYGSGAAACAGLSWWWWFGFAWPATALGIYTLAYATGRPRLLGKENGTLSPSAEWCLLPVLLVTRLVQRRWWKARPLMTELSPGVFFGRMPSRHEAEELAAKPLAVLDLTADSNAPPAFRERVVYRNIPVLDLVAPSEDTLRDCIAFIAAHHGTHTVFIHCQLGLQRSAAVAARWLVESGHSTDPEGAAGHLRRLQPQVVL